MTVLSVRSERYMNLVLKGMEEGFDTESARKDYMGYLSNIYEKDVRDITSNNLWTDIRALRESKDYDDRLKLEKLQKIDFPYALANVREKQYAAFEKFGADMDLLKKLVEMRATLKAYTLKPRASVLKKEAKAKLLASNTVIADATAPMKEAAVENTRVNTLTFIKHCKEKLTAVNFDPYVLVPAIKYASIWDTENYEANQMANKRRAIYFEFVKYNGVTSGKDVGYEWSQEGADNYLKTCMEQTALFYDSWVYKMNTKIEKPVSAVFAWENSNVWGYSMLVITKADGSVEKWKTQIIDNRSKFGEWFNQWPSRLVK